MMLASAAQNIIALSDSLFLYGNRTDFAAIGIVAVYYLVIASIGYAFSRGGQILISRRAGAKEYPAVGANFQAMLWFETGLAVVLFAFMYFCNEFVFQWIVENDDVREQCLLYLEYRIWGIWFSYPGLAMLALYTGLARTRFIVIDTLILRVRNIVLDYALINGHWGFPAMGIAGAALASTIAEALALAAFIVYMLWDKETMKYQLLRFTNLNLLLIKQQATLAFPIVVQSAVGMGSWFLFFGIVENLGKTELAVTNLVRMVYLILAIPTWGFASSTNTIVSNLIGQNRRQAVMPMIRKIAWSCFWTTLVISVPVTLFPQYALYPFLGDYDTALLDAAVPVFRVLLGILLVFSIASNYFYGLAGAGATWFGLWIQIVCVVGYIGYIYVVVEHTNGGLPWAWAAEIFYWLIMWLRSWLYVRPAKWKKIRL